MTPETKQQVLALIDRELSQRRPASVARVRELLETLSGIRILIDPPRDLEAELEAAKARIAELESAQSRCTEEDPYEKKAREFKEKDESPWPMATCRLPKSWALDAGAP